MVVLTGCDSVEEVHGSSNSDFLPSTFCHPCSSSSWPSINSSVMSDSLIVLASRWSCLPGELICLVYASEPLQEVKDRLVAILLTIISSRRP